jgi:hypothetical protein
MSIVDSFSVAAERHIVTALAQMRLDRLDDAPVEIRKRILREARDLTDKNVFGADHKRDRKGNPIEQGLGSHANPTQQSIEAYVKDQTQRRGGGPEEGFEENLKAVRARLAEFHAERKANKAGDDD